MSTLPKLAGRLAIGLLLVLLAAGTVLAAAAVRPSPAAFPPAEETSAPSAEAPTAEATTDPTAAPATEAPTQEPVDATTPPTAAPTAAPAREPEPADEDADGPPSAANLARVVEKLAAKGITTTTDQLAALAAKVGLGGAVRVLVFADASGKTPAQILAAFDSGKGWGVIAKELGLHPGIGSIMGNGNGLDKAAKAAEKAAKARERAERKAAQGD
jgi:hypothetical protein